MPNGGSDCCGTCWFNAKNKGEAGYGHSEDPEPAYCVIRELSVDDNPFYTYCGNHPHRQPERAPIPIGPVYTGDSMGKREIWQPSPDSEEIRLHLIELLRTTAAVAVDEYPLGRSLTEVVVWQLGEFREARAISDLRRIAQLDLGDLGDDPLFANRSSLSAVAATALDKIDRYQGCLLGLAVGDAVGTTVEFERPGTFEPVTDMVGGGPFKLEPGQWTDDTSMALCLAQSLLSCGELDVDDVMGRFVRWRHDGYMSSTGRCFDIGNTIGTSLTQFMRTGDPYSGSTDPHTAGNGSIMRLAPVVLFYAANPAVAIEKAAESSRTTHAAVEAVDGCRLLAAILIGALEGRDKEEILAPGFSPLGSWDTEPLAPLAPGIAAISQGSYIRKEPPEIRGTGYVVESLEAALWAFHRTASFEEGCLKAVNLGNDADTTAAVYGQIAGAFYGRSGIPESWLERLFMRAEIEGMSTRLRGSRAAD